MKTTLHEGTRTEFQQMMYAISLAYTQPERHCLSISEIHEIGCVAGHKFLKVLDQKLKPEHLKHCSGDELRSLFLLVVGTMFAVGYTDPQVPESGISVDDSQFKAMQSFLSQILAHYVLYIGTQLKLRIAGADQFLLQAAPTRWERQGLFQWNALPFDSQFQSDLPSDLVDLTPPIDCRHCLNGGDQLPDGMDHAPDLSLGEDGFWYLNNPVNMEADIASFDSTAPVEDDVFGMRGVSQGHREDWILEEQNLKNTGSEIQRHRSTPHPSMRERRLLV